MEEVAATGEEQEKKYTIEDLDVKLDAMQQDLIKMSMNFVQRVENGGTPEKAEVKKQKDLQKEYNNLLKIRKEMFAFSKMKDTSGGGGEGSEMTLAQAIQMVLKEGSKANQGHNMGSIKTQVQ